MIQATHHPIIYPLFCRYIKQILKWHFRVVKFIGNCPEDNRPVLLLSNHIGWWDGCWNLYFTRYTLKRKYYFMAGEQQLVRYPFMKRIGGFGIRPGSREILESLRYAVSLLASPAHAVLIYPQGKIASVYQHGIRFRKGVDYILQHLDNPVQVILIAYFTESGKEKKPGVWGYVTTLEQCPEPTIQKAYQVFYEKSRMTHIKNTSE